MDFSTLLPSGSLLYVGIGAVILLVILAAFLFKGKSVVAQTQASTDVTTTTESQAVTQPLETLPSTDLAQQMPVVESSASLPVAETQKATVPPLSSWKPSQEAAPLPASDDSSAASVPLDDSANKATS